MNTKYKIIYADPAWHFRVRSDKGEGRSAKNHYTVTSLEDMMALPIPQLADKDSVCLMWIIDPMIEQGYQLMRAWGYEPRTVAFYWAKLNKHWQKRGPINSLEEMERAYFTGLGYYTRANVEQCILGVRGKGLPRVSRSVRRLIVAPIGRHSAKPEAAYERIEQLFGNVKRLELFARTNRPGWSAWGNQVEDSITI